MADAFQIAVYGVGATVMIAPTHTSATLAGGAVFVGPQVIEVVTQDAATGGDLKLEFDAVTNDPRLVRVSDGAIVPLILGAEV